MLLLLACSGGIFLAIYFNVLILLPVSVVGSAIFIFFKLWLGTSFQAQLNDLVVLLIAAQAGYMLGLTGRDAYAYILARVQAAVQDQI